ncbi:putative ATPase [Mucilaginibacter oryzae]|uniref:Putative ATPase n=1 Tax=Mucilaginibacter oryzae TaxID=468058 RepID=A0A316GXU5_9SPHI|nr:AAA family ATPase [Mucilaginibacter oryzae]PWK69984.1 putative ATPase [Mucilaginibacter oryzae]
MDYIEIKGYKSIKEAKVELKPINILIGANGSGKSNFISFFDFLNRVSAQTLREYIGLNGGAERFLYQGSKVTPQISAEISFENHANAYSFTVRGEDDAFIFTKELLWFNDDPYDSTSYKLEASIKTAPGFRAKYIREHLNGFKKYHFHETGKNSPFTQMSNVQNGSYTFYEDGRNLASFLHHIKQNDFIIYNRIVKTIQSVAPYFSDFFLQANEEGHIRLQWQDKYSSTIYGASDLSDGTIRFIALSALFLQPRLRKSIIIDEPELGLHPFAITKLAGMIKSAAERGSQVIVATQSSDLVNHFEAEDIITVDQVDGHTEFKRLQKEELAVWLEDYSIGDLWQRNIIEGGQP